MAYEPPQPAIAVRIHDLVVLKEDRIAFEKAYQISEQSEKQVAEPSTKEFTASADYRHININGQEFHLGDVQARVIEQLHDATRSRTQWVHGKNIAAWCRFARNSFARCFQK